MEKLYSLIAALGEKNTTQKKSFSLALAPEETTTSAATLTLAIYGMPEENQAHFWCDIDDLPTLLKCDLVHVTAYTNARADKEY